MKPESSIRIHSEPYACTDGSITPGLIIVQNYLTAKNLSRAMRILDEHGLEEIAHYSGYASDPDGDLDSLLITVYPDIVANLVKALAELREVSDTVEAADLLIRKETENRLKVVQDRFEKDVEEIRKIVKG
jgi:hypothetical protein